MRRLVGLLVVLCLGLLDVASAEARPVQLEVRSADGAVLGHLSGYREDRATYVALADVARLVRGTLRPTDRGERLALVIRGKVVEVRRDSPQVLVGGRLVELSAPVRVRQGSWWAPGDLLVRALPLALGGGLQVAEGSAAPAPQPVARPVKSVSLPPRPPAAPQAPAVTAAVARPAARPAPPVEAPSAPAPAAPAPPAAAEAEPPAAPIKAGGVELRYRSYPAYTRIVLEGGAQFEPRLVESQGALVVPLAGLRAPAPRAARAVRDGLIAGLELGEVRGTAALRVSFERPPASRKVYRLKDPPRLVLDFYRGAPATPAAAGPVRGALQTIVLDPGHGGHDPGAHGPGGLQEKDLTLDVARRLAAILQDDLGVKVVLTRSRDQFLPLQERTAIANRQKADLFVSVHVNAARGASATGTETYFLSSEATDNAARAAAAFENKVIELEAGSRGGSRDLLRSILWDLAQSEFQQESSRLAESLQDSLERALRQPSRGVKQAPFYVLGGAAMPAVLVEIGFITNPKEEERLQDEGFRDRIARALAAGVAAYKKRYDQKSGVVAAR
jgi:N-acetylmuramoyl-L-alanine amidase